MTKKSSDLIRISDLREIMRRFKIPGVYDVNAANKQFYIDIVTKEIERQGITCDMKRKTIVSVIERVDVDCGATKMPHEKTSEMFILSDVDIASMVKNLLKTCKSGYCRDRSVTIHPDGRVSVSGGKDGKQETSILVKP